MPNRILKDSICTSETIDALSVEAEAFFYRLMVQCDDFGRMDARHTVLRSRCYPLRLDQVTDQQVSDWMTELEAAHLLWVYVVDERPYLQITTWSKHQQKRAKHSKFPQPPAPDSNGNQLISDASNSTREYEKREARNETPRNEKTQAPQKPARAGDFEPSQVDQPGQDPVKVLATLFTRVAGVPLDVLPKKDQGTQFWDPLRRMIKLADGQAGELLKAAVAQMRHDGLTIKSPGSVLGVFVSLHGAAQTGANKSTAREVS